ncbi:hypothetical protein SAMN04487897_14613 [Paenibacillus sp. yr247]|uniref:YciI family protein n=1 Tax=Paenibacillus sp. yr247 TaxID=1761880 RepID=UPI00088277EB|nr:YciI family protein [Paenibacillus sp. yr247]SDP20081.1 hypothetical protein SAMN04487897_14613 [Paenibacillus sp. yr247]
MIYVALLPIVDADKSARTQPAHLAYINRLYLEGNVVMAGPFADGLSGMVLYRADSEEEARRLAEHDPFVLEGARTLELRAWNALDFPLPESH